MSATGYSIERVYSPDNGVWYVEVWCKSTGKTEFTTDIYASEMLAVEAARNWIIEHEGYRHTTP